MSNLTYNIKLDFKCQEEKDLLLSTLLEHQKVWNFMSSNTFKSKKIDKKIIYDTNYHKCRKLFPTCPSQVIIRAKDSVYSHYKTLLTSKKLSTLKEPCEQKNLSIRLDKRIYTFLENNQIKLTTIGKRITCSYQPYLKFQELFSKYSVCDPLLFIKENEVWLAVSFEIPEPTHIENSYLGVDLGIRRFAVTSEGLAISDKCFLQQKRGLRYNKRQLQSKIKTSKSHSAKRKLKMLKRKEHNKNKALCHLVSNQILKTKANTIVLEDLSSLKKKYLNKNNFEKSKSSKNSLSQAPFYMLKEVLSYKALLFGKKVVTVDPSYTSQNDYRGIEKGIRKGCRYYASDGKMLDADWNASINIARKYTLKKEAQGIKHPISFSEPVDGKLNFVGRLTSTNQSYLPKMQAATSLD